MDEEELERIKENFKRIEPQFDLIDEQIDKSMKISKETWNFYFDI